MFKCGIALVDTTGISKRFTECALSFLGSSAYDASIWAMELDELLPRPHSHFHRCLETESSRIGSFSGRVFSTKKDQILFLEV
jgi:hypothetical protein